MGMQGKNGFKREWRILYTERVEEGGKQWRVTGEGLLMTPSFLFRRVSVHDRMCGYLGPRISRSPFPKHYLGSDDTAASCKDISLAPSCMQKGSAMALGGEGAKIG